MIAEEAHEVGRTGALRAHNLLWRLLGRSISLPFNAYDHRPKLTFSDKDAQPPAEFAFDLGGVLQRPAAGKFGDQHTVEVFVEVKAVTQAGDLLDEYRKFMRRAAVACLEPKHRDTWFIFVAGVPFGTTYGVKLCDGQLLEECARDWPDGIRRAASGLSDRLSLVIVNKSFERLLASWGAGS